MGSRTRIAFWIFPELNQDDHIFKFLSRLVIWCGLSNKWHGLGLGTLWLRQTLKELAAGGRLQKAYPAARQQTCTKEGSVWCISTSTTVLSPMSLLFSCSVMSDSLRPRGLQHTRLPCPSPSPELAQTHVHRVGDAIQPSHPLSSPSPPAFNLSQHQSLF